MTGINWRDAYLRLSPGAAIKNLEVPFVYHAGRDELYEIDETAAAFLMQCNGTRTGRSLTGDSGFVEFCLEENLLEAKEHSDPADGIIGEKTDPSLRYLELQLTHKCNLRCAHCYIGPHAGDASMPLSDAVNITRAFSAMGGLRLLISGGEPLLYEGLGEYLRQISALPVRRVLLTNGTRITRENIGALDVHEIQFSLDGWEYGHDLLRGAGTFAKTMQGVRIAQDFGVPISFATMIHSGNTGEFDRMAAFMEEAGAVEWGVDALCVAGALAGNRDFLVDADTCARRMMFGFGGGYHGASEGYACGRHLMTVLPDGCGAKCGFYMDAPAGDARSGLRQCWAKIEHVPLSALECRDCGVVDECRGGCRYRASGPLAPDPVMCRLYGVAPY